MRVHTLTSPHVYATPDTSTPPVGELPSGSYPLVEQRTGQPTASTDYALVSDPSLPKGQGWMCTRWTGQVYAEVFPDALWVDESSLIAQLPAFAPFTYGKAYYPHPLPGVPLHAPPPTTSDCCAFVEAVIVGAFAKEHADLTWGPSNHAQAMVLGARDLFSSVDVYVNQGMASPVRLGDALPKPWTVLQGWSTLDPPHHGHNLLIIDVDEAKRTILTLECNDGYGLNGPGFRNLGNLRDAPGGHPGSDWSHAPKAPTWQSYVSHTPHRRAAQLHVRNVRWVASGPTRWST